MARERDGKQRRPFARGRRVGQASSLADLGGRVKRLIADPRFQALSNRDARVLFVALVQHADGFGRWWTSHQTLAATVGLDVRTVQRAVEGFSDPALSALVDPPRPLVTVEPWLRPPGAAGGAQGSNTYKLDPALLDTTRVDSSDDPCDPVRTDDPARVDRSVEASRDDRSDHPDRVLNEDKNAARATQPAETAATRAEKRDIRYRWHAFVSGQGWDDCTHRERIVDELERLRAVTTTTGSITDEDALALFDAERARRYPNDEPVVTGLNGSEPAVGDTAEPVIAAAADQPGDA